MTRPLQTAIRLNYYSSMNLSCIDDVFMMGPQINFVNKQRRENACDVLKIFIFNGDLNAILFSYQEEQFTDGQNLNLHQTVVSMNSNPPGTQIKKRKA